MYKNVQKHLVPSTDYFIIFLLKGEEKMDLNIIELIIQEFKPSTEEHKRIKLFLETHKERIICLKSIYQSIKLDLLHDIHIQINE